MKRMLVVLALGTFVLAGTANRASALSLSAEGAGSFNAGSYSFVSTPSLMLAAEATFGISELFQLGFVLDHNFLSYQNNAGTGALNFYGGLARLGLPFGLFADTQLGVAKRDSQDSEFSWGLGAGIRLFTAPLFELSPRVSYRSVPDSSVGRSLLDIGLLFTFKIL